MKEEKEQRKARVFFISLLVLIIAWIGILLVYPPTEIVGKIGVGNGYLIAFLVAAIGGITTFTGSSYYLIIATLAAGGLNPLLLGLAGGIGAGLSDSVFFFLGRGFRGLISRGRKERIKAIAQKLHNKPLWIAQLGTYLYIGFTPFPNDIIMIAAGVLHYKYRQIALPIFAGAITSTTLFAYFGSSILGLLF